MLFRPLTDVHRMAVLQKAIERAADTFGFTEVNIQPELLRHLAGLDVDPASGVRGVEHLIDVELGTAFVAAVRDGVTTWVALLGPPASYQLPDLVGTVTSN